MKGRKNWILRNIIVTGIILLALAILAPLLINQPAFIDHYNFEKNVKIGQAFSGYMMPFIGLIGAVLTFGAFYIQFLANKRIQEQFALQQANDHFYKMLDIHVRNVEEFEITSYSKKETITSESTITRNPIHDLHSPKVEKKSLLISKDITYGRRCFLLMLKDFHFTIWQVNKKNSYYKGTGKELSTELMLQVAYRIFFWGTDTQHIYPRRKENLSDNEILTIDLINTSMHSIRKNIRDTKKGQINTVQYPIGNGNTVTNEFRFIPMSGHSSRLAHYYRHLYQTVKHIHNTSKFKEEEFLKEQDIDLRFKTLRAQMSNEEQLLLYYNYKCGFGGKWDYRYDDLTKGSSKHQFLTKYKMIHNIPLHDTIYSLIENPQKHFETYKIKFPDADLFEWS